jgi:hypothetical protein
MRRALWPSIAALGAIGVIYADAMTPGMTLGGRITAAVAIAVLPIITWIAAYRRSNGQRQNHQQPYGSN